MGHISLFTVTTSCGHRHCSQLFHQLGFLLPSAFLVMNGGGSQNSKTLAFPKESRVTSLQEFPLSGFSIREWLRFELLSNKVRQQCLVTWSLRFASCILPKVSFTPRLGTGSSGALFGVLGTSLKSGWSWYFVCAELLPKTQCFLTSVDAENLQPLNKSLL